MDGARRRGEPLNVIIGAVGSGGDVNPMLAIGAELKRRGCACTILAGSWQEPAARRLGLPFHAILSEEQFHVFTANSNAETAPGRNWLTFFYDAVFPAVAATYDYVCAHAVPGRTLLIGATHVIGLRLAAERHGLPLITTNVQPEPIRPAPDHEFSIYLNGLFTRLLDQQRVRAGLPRSTLPFIDWLDAGARVASLFPEWFLAPGIDAPARAQGRTLNFIFDDPDDGAGTNPAIDAFLARHEQPIVFTAGTGNHAVRAFFAAAVEAAAQLGRPAILLTRAREQLPPHLPRDVLHADYLPFAGLLPFAGAIVHHGGIGTCAQALRAGIPQVVIPGGFDQFDNAARNVAFGVGARMDATTLGAPGLARTLDAVLSSATVARRCREFRARFDPRHTLGWCCDGLLELAAV